MTSLAAPPGHALKVQRGLTVTISVARWQSHLNGSNRVQERPVGHRCDSGRNLHIGPVQPLDDLRGRAAEGEADQMHMG